MAYLLRVNISNQGLNDSFYERKISFNMGRYITLKKAFYQEKIYSEKILDDSKYFQPAEMYYDGSDIFFLYFITYFMSLANENNESIYELKIKNMMKGHSITFVFIGYITHYMEAYQTSIYIQDLGALSSIFLKSKSSFIFFNRIIKI